MKFLFYLVWVSASGWFFGCCFCGCCFSPILFPYFSWRKSMVGEGVLCTWLLWRYHSWFYNPLNYYSTCSWNARWHRNLSISRRDQLRPRLPHARCCTSTGLEESPEVLTPIMSTKWKISVFMMPAASRGLTNWGKLFVLGSCLFVFTQSEGFFWFWSFCNNMFSRPTDSWKLYIFTNKIWHPTAQLFTHWGVYSPQGKKHFQIWSWVQLMSSSASTKINRRLASNLSRRRSRHTLCQANDFYPSLKRKNSPKYAPDFMTQFS